MHAIIGNNICQLQKKSDKRKINDEVWQSNLAIMRKYLNKGEITKSKTFMLYFYYMQTFIYKYS